jgi:sulfur carrier protein
VHLTVNGEHRVLPGPASVAELIDGLAGDGLAGLAGDGLAGRHRGVAVAVNGEVVPRSAWRQRSLTDGDAVEVLTAVQGG